MAISQVVFGMLFSVLMHAPLTLNTTCQPANCTGDLGTSLRGVSDGGCNDDGGINCTQWRYHQDDSLWELYTWLHAAITKIFPIIFIGTFNVLIALHLRSISRRRSRLNTEINRNRPPRATMECSTNGIQDLSVVTSTSHASPSGGGVEQERGRARKQWLFLTHRTLHEQTMAWLSVGIAVLFIICNVPANIAYMQFQFQAQLIATDFATFNPVEFGRFEKNWCFFKT